MAEHKDYWITEGDEGTIKISEEVIASIAALAATETEGVGGLCTGFTTEIAHFLGRKNAGKGVKVQLGERDTVSVEISILVRFGKSVEAVAHQVQKAAKASIESMTSLRCASVHIIVGGIAFEQPPKTVDQVMPSIEA